jgi:hypothetical protein
MEKIILHAFEKDGIIHPPVEAECGNCSYSVSKIVGFNFGGEVIRCYCHFIDEFVDDQFVCVNHDLDLMRLSDEQIEEYERLEDAGELDINEEAEAKRTEIEEFLSS